MMHPRGTVRLIEAICLQAVKDYRRKRGEDVDARIFFKSEWFYALTDVRGGIILERLDKEIKLLKKREAEQAEEARRAKERSLLKLVVENDQYVMALVRPDLTNGG